MNEVYLIFSKEEKLKYPEQQTNTCTSDFSKIGSPKKKTVQIQLSTPCYQGHKESSPMKNVSSLLSTPVFTKGTSPCHSDSKVVLNRTPKPYQQSPGEHCGLSPNPAQLHISSSQSNESCGDAATNRSRTAGTSRSSATPTTAIKNLQDRPVSARLASWEQKLTGSGIPDTSHGAPHFSISSIPRCSLPRASVLKTPVELTSADSKPGIRKSIDDEPTAHPVSARMSAWEQLSSANVISDVKRVCPGGATPLGPSSTPVVAKKPVVAAGSGQRSRTGKGLLESVNRHASRSNAVGNASVPRGSLFGNISSCPSANVVASLSVAKADEAVRDHAVGKIQTPSLAEHLRQERFTRNNAVQLKLNGVRKEESQTEVLDLIPHILIQPIHGNVSDIPIVFLIFIVIAGLG